MMNVTPEMALQDRVLLPSFGQSPDLQADLATLTAFLNALLREWDGWGLLSEDEAAALGLAGPYVSLPLSTGDRVLVPYRDRTAFRFLFELPVHLAPLTGPLQHLPVPEAIAKLVFDENASPGDLHLQHLLLSRVLDSRRGTFEALRANRRAPKAADRWTFQEAEQALLLGHPTHPNPRSKDEISAADAERYAPELGGRFPLFWSLVHRDLLDLTSGTQVSAATMCRDLAASDAQLDHWMETEATRPDFVPLPSHPWQAERLLARPEVLAAMRDGTFLPFGPMGQAFAATGSFRGAHAYHAPYMLKFSLSLRLTNSRRVLARKEVERGVQLAQLLEGPFGARLWAEFPSLQILKEPGYAALKDPSGGPMEDSFVVFRDNPFDDAGAAGPIMLASLCEFRMDGTCPLADLIVQFADDRGVSRARAAELWLERFLGVAIMPVLEIRARHGLLFGSHQQNMMIGLEDGLPARLVLRDCQGTGHLTTHHEHLARFMPDIGAHAENIVPPDLGDSLMIYYVIVNNLMNVVSALALHGLLDEKAAYRQIRAAFLEARAQSCGDTTLYDRLLNAEHLVSKGNYRTSLSNVNEASGDGDRQLAAYFDLPNPISSVKAI
ncbi:IucA/IucC family protein [Pseudovibrio exalbescens]|uniref:IucA/IucC family protein n=1 Tax=Pseudovibrio exalbescens TaxID=197461 RepID=UPI0023673D1E|nr:IucA/IucC family protein [Pseudovibrio exalbescens]MDD7912006.1 IucA/IucC family protein [Pseudovibrio exalbescens]